MRQKSFAAGRELIFSDHGDTVIDGHAEAIFRVCRNPIDNVLSHAPGDTSIEIAAGPGPQISVRGHGPGIAAADRPLLFARFWRKDRSHSQGAGLGLGIVKQLVDAHGGSIDIANAERRRLCVQRQVPGCGRGCRLTSRRTLQAWRSRGSRAGLDTGNRRRHLTART